MRPAPVRRLTAAAGLVALVPVAMMLIADYLTPREAATRALIILVAVLVLTRLLGLGLRVMVGSLEGNRRRAARRAPGEEDGT